MSKKTIILGIETSCDETAVALVEENGSNRLKVKITPGKNIAPGMYPMRVFNSDGLSDPVRVGVDRLPHKVFLKKNRPCRLPSPESWLAHKF